jgi:hypothetical protein
MPLINCPACGHKISVEAEACPECGHPNRPSTRVPAGPKCYACSATATTRCQSCGALSCALHLQSIYVQHGDGGAYELRCKSCYESAQSWKVVGWIILAAFVIFILFICLAKSGHH